jgi:hypothetical protein
LFRLFALWLASGYCASLIAGDANKAKRYFKYTDERGITVLDDTVPPEYVDKGYSIVDDQGFTLQVVPPAKTAEEIREAERLAGIREERLRQAEKRADQDRLLLQTYTEIGELEAARDKRLGAMDNLMRVAEHNLTQLRAELQKLSQEAADKERQGRAVPQALLERIQDTRKQVKEAQTDMHARRAQRQQLGQRFQRDLERYRELKRMSPKERRAALYPRSAQ